MGMENLHTKETISFKISRNILKVGRISTSLIKNNFELIHLDFLLFCKIIEYWQEN